MVENLNTLVTSISGPLESWDDRDPVIGTVFEELDAKKYVSLSVITRYPNRSRQGNGSHRVGGRTSGRDFG